jgi:hypothetical protein
MHESPLSFGGEFEFGSMIKQHFTAWVALLAFLIAGTSGPLSWCLGGNGHIEMGNVTCCLESRDQRQSNCCTVADNAPADDGCESCVHVPVFAIGPNSSFTRIQYPSARVQESAIEALVSCATLDENLRFGDFSRKLSFVSSSGPASLRTAILLI